MARTVPANVLTAINSSACSLATLVLITLSDGTTIPLTDWDEPLDVNLRGDGVETYLPYQFQELSAFSSQINAPIDDRDFSVILGDTTLTAKDIRRGRLN